MCTLIGACRFGFVRLLRYSPRFCSKGVHHLLHYLDDFLLFGAPASQEGEQVLRIAFAVFAAIGVPVFIPKLEGPSTVVTFLGIVIDTERFQLRLHSDKLARLRALVSTWRGRRSGLHAEMESLLGHLSHAAVVVKPGRIFLRHLFSLLAGVHQRHHFVHLDVVARADLAWWDCFLVGWHGSAFIIPEDSTPIHVHSDVSGGFGCGAFSSDRWWFQLSWPPSWANVDISVKELVPIVLAAAVWGRAWRGRQVVFHCYNAAVVAVLGRWSARHPALLHLLRCLYFYLAWYHFSYIAVHLPGVSNTAADALSRDNVIVSLSHSPGHTIPGTTAVAGAASHPSTGLGLERLDQSVQEYFVSALAPATQRCYRSAANSYLSFCHQFQVLSAFPLSQLVVCRFVSFLASGDVSHATIRVYLSGLRFAQIALGLADPGLSLLPQLEYVLCRIRKASPGARRVARLPITPQVLTLLRFL